MDKKEIRYLPISQMQIRKNENDETKLSVVGYVVKFNERSQLLYDEFYEKVARGAFSKSLEDNTIKALWDHNTNLVLGSTRSKTLRLKEDDTGLYFELDLPNNEIGKNAYESITRGDVDGVSFGFFVRDDGWEYKKDEDVYERTLLDIDLREISPTPFPAYENSEVNKRSILLEMNIKTKEQRKLELEKLKLKIKLLEI